MKKTGENRTGFLNVDLDVYSRSNLEPLAVELGDRVSVLYVGRERGIWSVHLEIAGQPAGADEAIRAFVGLVRKLSRAKKKLWNGAKSREFNIGVQSGNLPRCFEISLEAKTVELVAEVGGRIVVSVYGATKNGKPKTQLQRRRMGQARNRILG
jgi:hypothetical protein